MQTKRLTTSLLPHITVITAVIITIEHCASNLEGATLKLNNITFINGGLSDHKTELLSL